MPPLCAIIGNLSLTFGGALRYAIDEECLQINESQAHKGLHSQIGGRHR